MDLLESPIVLAFVCMLTYYRMGVHEARFDGKDHGLLWACLSAAVSLLLSLITQNWTSLLVTQIALFFGIALFRAAREPHP